VGRVYIGARNVVMAQAYTPFISSPSFMTDTPYPTVPAISYDSSRRISSHMMELKKPL